MLKLPLALVALGLGAGAGQAQQQPGPMPKTVYISEVMTSNKLYDVGGETPDWIELANYGGEWVDLNGFRLSDKCDFDSGYALPGGQNVGPNERIVFLADGSGRSISNNVYLDFRLSSSGETVRDGQSAETIPPLIARLVARLISRLVARLISRLKRSPTGVSLCARRRAHQQDRGPSPRAGSILRVGGRGAARRQRQRHSGPRSGDAGRGKLGSGCSPGV